MDRRWTVKSEEALARARALARDKAHARVTTGHLLAALFEADSFVSLYLQRLGSEPGRALARVTDFVADLPSEPGTPRDSQDVPTLHADLAAALDQAARWAEELDDEYVSAENLLLGLAGGDDDIALTLQAAGVGRGGWQSVVRLRRELWQRQVRPRPRPPGFDPSTARVLVVASRRAKADSAVLAPAHVLEALVAEAPLVGALLSALGLEPTSVRQAAAEIASRATPVPDGVLPPVVSPPLHAAIASARGAADLPSDVGPLAMLRGLAQDSGEVGQLLRGMDEMLAMLAARVREPASRLAGAVMAQQRAMQQSDLETAARLLHGDIPLLEQEIETMGQAEAVLVKLLNQQSTSVGAQIHGAQIYGAQLHGAQADGAQIYGAQGEGDQGSGAWRRGVQTGRVQNAGVQNAGVQGAGTPLDGTQLDGAQLDGAETGGAQLDGAETDAVRSGREYEQILVALDTARTREISRRLLRWLGDRDVTPGDSVELAAFCATVHDGPIAGREAGHAAGRLALLGLITRDEESVRLTAAGLRCLEDQAGDPEPAPRP